MPVLVTGAGGFVGAGLAARLAGLGGAVAGLYRSGGPGRAPAGVRQVPGDILRVDSLRAALRGIDTVYHAAAAFPGGAPASRVRSTNLDGTKNLVRAAIENGVRRLVFLSSAAVYRPPHADPVREGDPTGGTEAYGESKSAAEAAIREGCAGRMEYVILRPCQVYGPGDGAGYTGRLLRILRAPCLPLTPGARRGFSLLHIRDLLDALVAAGGRADIPSGTYNLAPSERISLPGLADIIAKLTGRRPLLMPCPQGPLRFALGRLWARRLERVRGGEPGEPTEYGQGGTQGILFLGGPAYDIRAAASAFGFRPRVAPEEGLGKLLGYPGGAGAGASLPSA